MDVVTFPIETVLLDVDGTLLDTREFILQAFEFTCARHGIDAPTREVLSSQVGLSLEEIYESLEREHATLLIETHRAFQVENLHLARAFPGVAETLEALRGAGLALAAVTSRSRRTSVLTLELTGLAPWFDTVVSAEDAQPLKPDPAPLRFALERLGRHHSTAAMVGDTAHDVSAGKALGTHTVAVTYGFAGASVRESLPDAVIESFVELPQALGLA
jgi:pyrophosphatase PpaX